MNQATNCKSLTILIPTRNRARCLAETISSAVEFRDSMPGIEVEIVISDNSDQPGTLPESVTALPVRVIRPPKVMAMAEHWNWAIENVSAGHYALLTDRSLIMAREFGASYKALLDSGQDLVSHSFLGYNDYRFPYLLGMLNYTRKLHALTSAELQEDARHARFWTAFPRALNCIFSDSLKSRIKQQFGEVFAGVAPDFNFAFKVCATTSSILFHDVPGFMSIGGNVSNGRSYSSGTASGNADFNKMSLSRRLSTPYPDSMLPINIILHELVSILGPDCFFEPAFEQAILRTLATLNPNGCELSLHALPESFRQKLSLQRKSSIGRIWGNLTTYRRVPTIRRSYGLAKSVSRQFLPRCDEPDRRFCF